jgi:hypothetical protein
MGGYLLLGETITWPLVVGGAIIIAGVSISQWQQISIEEPKTSPAPRKEIRTAVERLVASTKEAQRPNS